MEVIVYRRDPVSELGVLILVIVLVAVIGYISQPPPETTRIYYTNDASKLQYIQIGGSTTTKVTT